jgi:hypothetical protein
MGAVAAIRLSIYTYYLVDADYSIFSIVKSDIFATFSMISDRLIDLIFSSTFHHLLSTHDSRCLIFH